MSQTKIDKACTYLQQSHNAEFAAQYGEPGYQDTAKGIIFANWNDVPKGLANWLEGCGFALEWSDEWMIDHDHGKAYRTSPDSYSWESQIMLPAEACEYITPDDGAEAWIDACAMTSNGQPYACLPSWVAPADIMGAGFALHQTDLEHGFHVGMDDSPQDIAKQLFADGAHRVVFRKLENSQFYARFEAYADMNGEH